MKIEDKDEIIEICKTTWEGTDHIPALIEQWLTSKREYPMVGVVNNKVIAVITATITDESTAFISGLRVHPDCRSNRIGEKFFALAMEYVSKHENIKRYRGTIKESNQAMWRIGFAQGWEEIYSMMFIRVLPPFSEPYFPKKDICPPIDLQQLDIPSFVAHVSALTKDHRQSLIPEDIIMVDWVPYTVFSVEKVASNYNFEIYVHIKQKLESFIIFQENKLLDGINVIHVTIYCTNIGELDALVHYAHKIISTRKIARYDLSVGINNLMSYRVLCDYFGNQALDRMLLTEKNIQQQHAEL